MAILRGQEAMQYMQQNPQGSYNVISGGMGMAPVGGGMTGATQGQGGLLQRIGKGIISPFQRLYGGALNVGSYLGENLGRAMTGDDFIDYNKWRRYGGMDRGPFGDIQKALVGEKLSGDIEASPLEEMFKGGLGVGSYFVPGGASFGGGLKGAVTSGALQSGMGAIGATEGTDFGNILRSAGTGALTGGVVGGGLYGLGQGLQRLGGRTAQERTAAGLTSTRPADAIQDELETLFNRPATKQNLQKIYQLEDDLMRAGMSADDVAGITFPKKYIEQELVEQGVDIAKLPKGSQGGIVGKLRDYQGARNQNALKRVVGVNPTKKMGGNQLIKDVIDKSDELGIAINSADDLANLSDELFSRHGSTVRNQVTELAEQGVTINLDDVVDDLTKMADEALPSDKQQIMRVIEDIEGYRSQYGDDIASVYSLKQELGSKGKWSPISDPNLRKGTEAYEKVYNQINKKLEDAIGSDVFRNANENVELAIKSKQWAERAGLKTPSGSFNDPLQDAAMYGGAVAGGPGAVAGLVASRYAQSPRFERLLARGAGGLADMLDGGLPQGVGEAAGTLGRGLSAATPYSGMIGTAITAGIRPGAGGEQQGGGQMGMQPQGIPQGGLGYQPGLYEQRMAQIQLEGIQAGLDPSAAAQIADLTLRSQGIMPTAEMQQMYGAGETGTATSQIDMIQQLIDAGMFGSVKGLASKLPGGLAPRAKEAEAVLAAAAQTIGRQLEGGKLTDADIQRYKRDILPRLTDSPEVAQRKLNVLRQVVGGGL